MTDIFNAIKKIFGVAFAPLMFNVNVQWQTTFFGSPKGDDANHGTRWAAAIILASQRFLLPQIPIKKTKH